MLRRAEPHSGNRLERNHSAVKEDQATMLRTVKPHLLNRARTKVVATLGPACADEKSLTQLIQAGVDVFRLNMAHGTREEHTATFTKVRRLSEELDEPIAILVDLAGPKIRLGELLEDPLELEEGQPVAFVRANPETPYELVSAYEELIDDLEVGNRVMLADGTVSFRVLEKTENSAKCVVVQGGTLRSRQGVNLPGVHVSTPSLTPTDRDNAEWAVEVGADFISLSFVRTADDIAELKKITGNGNSTSGRARIIAKIEKPEALDNLHAIVREADGVMVARGDLGVEIDVSWMAMAQKEIIRTCNRLQKPVITATQMLDSMQHNRYPTRAEATDVANAILDGTDACMLSGETAIGDYPVQAVKMMESIALATEGMLSDRNPLPQAEVDAEGLHQITQSVVYGAEEIARHLKARLIVVASHSGATALAMSNRRCDVPVIGVSDSPTTLRQMNLFWGVVPVTGAPTQSSAELARHIETWGRERDYLHSDDRILVIRGTRLGSEVQNVLVVHELT